MHPLEKVTEDPITRYERKHGRIAPQQCPRLIALHNRMMHSEGHGPESDRAAFPYPPIGHDGHNRNSRTRHFDLFPDLGGLGSNRNFWFPPGKNPREDYQRYLQLLRRDNPQDIIDRERARRAQVETQSRRHYSESEHHSRNSQQHQPPSYLQSQETYHPHFQQLDDSYDSESGPQQGQWDDRSEVAENILQPTQIAHSSSRRFAQDSNQGGSQSRHRKPRFPGW